MRMMLGVSALFIVSLRKQTTFFPFHVKYTAVATQWSIFIVF